MTLVKLDSGDYINLDVVEVIAEKYVSFIGDGITYITPADRDRIMKAMNPQKTSREILVNEILVKAQAIADLSAILNYTDGGIDVAKALRGISDDLSKVANA